MKAESGEEPIAVVKIEWPSGTKYYSDRDIAEGPVNAEGRLIEVAAVRQEIKANQAGSIGSVSLVLSDNDLVILNELNNNCVFRSPAALYHYFVGGDELVPLMDGTLDFPVVWNESNQTFECSIISKYRGEDLLCKSADGDAFPLVFGRVLNVPAFQDTVPPSGSVLEAFDQDATEFQFEVKDEGFTEGSEVTLDVGGEHITGTITIDDGIATVAISGRNQIKHTLLSATKNLLSANQQTDLRYAALAITDERIVGNWLTTYFPTEGVSNYVLYQSGAVTRCQLPWFSARPIDIGWTVLVRKYPPNQAYWTQDAGTDVYEVGQKSKYVVNCAANSSIYQVTVKKDDKYVVIPEAWYTLQNRTVNGQTVTGIIFDTPLEMRELDNDIYVDVESPLSDNTAEIIEWIVTNKLEGFTADATSFAEVAEKLENYPSRFALTDQKDALTAAADIAWQARCGLFTVGSTVYIKYLSEEPSSPLGFGDILEGTPKITYSDELVTKFIARWKKHGLDEEREYIVETNVDEFGLEEQDYNFYIYDRKSLVEKSADFWAARYGNIWTLVSLGTTMESLQVEILDYVNLNLDIVTNGTVRALVELVDYDTNDKSFQLELRTPIKCGEMDESEDFWSDDSGDTKPPKRTPAEADYAEEVEASPLDLTYTFQTALGLGIGETDGVFTADSYNTSDTTGTPDEEAVTGKRVGDWVIEDGDEVVITDMPDGTRVAFKPSAPIAYIAQALGDENGIGRFTAEISQDVEGDQIYRAAATVTNLGDEPVVTNDIIPVWKLPTGDWICDKPAASAGGAGEATIGTKVNGRTYNATIDGAAVEVYIVNAPSTDTVPEGTKVVALKDADGNWIAQVPVWL